MIYALHLIFRLCWKLSRHRSCISYTLPRLVRFRLAEKPIAARINAVYMHDGSFKKGAWLLATLAGFVLFSLQLSKQHSIEKSPLNLLAAGVDAVVLNLSVHQFGDDGVIKNTLFTPEVTHFPQQKIHQLRNPTITVHQDNQPDWQIQANMAHALLGEKKITFLGDVMIQQPEKGNQLHTDSLTYYTEKKLATSSAMIEFKQPGSIVHSQGMRAYLDKKVIQLLSKPHATFTNHPQV